MKFDRKVSMKSLAKLVVAPVVVLSAVLVLTAGCGGSTNSSSGTESSSMASSMEMTTTTTAAKPAGAVEVDLSEYMFDPSTVQVKAGDVTFYLVNKGTIPHNFAIKLASGWDASPDVDVAQSATFVVKGLTPGTYDTECTVAGHAQSGMVGKLVVS